MEEVEVESLSPEVVPDLEAGPGPFVPRESPTGLAVLAGASWVTCLVTLTKSSVSSVLLRGSVVIALLMASRTLLDLLYTARA